MVSIINAVTQTMSDARKAKRKADPLIWRLGTVISDTERRVTGRTGVIGLRRASFSRGPLGLAIDISLPTILDTLLIELSKYCVNALWKNMMPVPCRLSQNWTELKHCPEFMVKGVLISRIDLSIPNLAHEDR